VVTGRSLTGRPGADQLRIDPESVAAAGRELAGVAQRMADDVARLESTVGGSSNPWGGDEAGGVFAVAYRAVVVTAMDAFGSYTEQVGFAAANLVMEARAVSAADADSAAALAAGAAPGVPAGILGAATGAARPAAPGGAFPGSAGSSAPGGAFPGSAGSSAPGGGFPGSAGSAPGGGV
jgi:hypothetical protein